MKPYLCNSRWMQPLLACAAKTYTRLYLLHVGCLPHSLALSPPGPLLHSRKDCVLTLGRAETDEVTCITDEKIINVVM